MEKPMIEENNASSGAGLYIYNPILDSFTEFNLVNDKGYQ